MGFENSDFRIERIDLSNRYDVKLVNEFLIDLGFDFDLHSVEYTMILYNLNNQIIGTGSYMKGVLKYVVVAPKFRETSAFAQIVTHLNDKVLNCGYKTVFVFTRPCNSIKFQGLGFKEICVVQPLYALLDLGYYTINNYKKYLRGKRRETTSTDIAAVVVNCNPFTNGHLYLIEKAASENEVVYLFVVEEDRSVFPFEKRLQLVEQGTAHLHNVVIIKGGAYVVSGATFPSYFLKSETIDDITRKQTELDISLFARHIVPELNITKRYVGTEVYCTTTAAYNETMMRLLPEYQVQVIEVPRKAVGSESDYISASKVRDALKENSLESIKLFLPAVTYDFLNSLAAAPIIAAIKTSDSRH